MKPNAHIRMFFKSFTIACLVIGYVSCVDDEELSNINNKKSDVVTFGINQSNKWQADIVGESEKVKSRASTANNRNLTQSNRSEGVLMDYKSNEKLEEEIYIYVIEDNCTDYQNNQVAKSRGTEDSNHASFGVIAYKGTGEIPMTYDGTSVDVFMNNVAVDSEGNVIGNQYYWPGGNTWLKFFAYSPADASFITNNENIYFPSINYSVSENVNQQHDLMLGESELRNGAVTNSVEIPLKHLLSKIQVKVGNLGSNAVVTSIAFKGIKSKGTYQYTSKDNSDGYGGSWLIDETTTDFKQPYTSDAESTDASTTNAILEIDETTKIAGEPFYLLPQDLGNASIEITLEVTSSDTNNQTRTHNYTLSKSLAEISQSWSSDKQYTYVITTPEEVEVEVTDEVNNKIKENLVIRNTGLAPAYIRAAIVGNWVILGDDDNSYEDDIIVAKWDLGNEGTFNWGKDNENAEPTNVATKGWRKHIDGYYYHLNPVARGAETAQLFESFSIENVNPPVAGAVLDLTILVQAVLPDDVGIAWPQEITSEFVQTAFLRD